MPLVAHIKCEEALKGEYRYMGKLINKRMNEISWGII